MIQGLDEETTEFRYRVLAKHGVYPGTIAELRRLLFMQPDHLVILCSLELELIENRVSVDKRNDALLAVARVLSRGRRRSESEVSAV